MDRTLVGDLEQFDTLLLRKLAGDRDLALDPIEHALCGFTFGAVVGVDPRMAQANRHAADRPPFPSRIQRDRHGRDRKSTRLNSSHVRISYAVFCLKKKKRPGARCAGRDRVTSSIYVAIAF